MRIAWFVPFVLLGLAACSITNPPPAAPAAATVIQPAPAVVAPTPGTTVITRP